VHHSISNLIPSSAIVFPLEHESDLAARPRQWTSPTTFAQPSVSIVPRLYSTENVTHPYQDCFSNTSSVMHAIASNPIVQSLSKSADHEQTFQPPTTRKQPTLRQLVRVSVWASWWPKHLSVSGHFKCNYAVYLFVRHLLLLSFPPIHQSVFPSKACRTECVYSTPSMPSSYY